MVDLYGYGIIFTVTNDGDSEVQLKLYVSEDAQIGTVTCYRDKLILINSPVFRI